MLNFFDANCMFGNRSVVREGSVLMMDEYKELYSRAGVSKVMMYHSLCVTSDIREGNEAICKVQKENENITGQWVIMPSVTNEFPSCEVWLQGMREHEIKSVRMFPKKQNFSMESYACGDIYECLEKNRIPLFIQEEEISYPVLYEILKSYSDMPVVLCNAGYIAERQVYPLVSACPNLYVETSVFVAHQSVERFVNQFGAERMIFGSGVPNSSVCGAVFSILYACISEEDKQKIASENLGKLLGEVML